MVGSEGRIGPGNVFRFLAGGGEMGQRIRFHNWSATPVGAPEVWPQPLRMLVGLMLGSQQPMFTTWGPKRILLYNDSYIPILGLRHPGALGRPFPEIWFEVWDELEPLFDRADAGEATHKDEITQTLRRNGYPEEAHFAASYTPVRDRADAENPDGRVAGLFCICTETTDRVLAERALRASEEHLRQLNATLEQHVEERTRDLRLSEGQFRAYFNASPEHLFLFRVKPNGDLLYQDVNPAALAVYGRPREAILGRAPAEVMDADTALSIEANVRNCLKLGRPVHYEVARSYHPNQTLSLSVVVAPLGFEDSGDRLVLFCGRDVTEQRQVEAELRQSQKMEAVGQLTGGIAHDMNNMLQAIAGSLELIQLRVEQGRAGATAGHVETARRTVERAAGLTQRLLAFARRQALQPKPVEPDELIAGMEELICRTLGAGIAVELRLGDGVWEVLCDQNQLESAMLNLVINARDAMPDGGTLRVATADRHLAMGDVSGQTGAAPGEYVEISVSDTGTGMTPDVMLRAFEPFFTTKPLGQGTGLGLSQLHGFVGQSGGFVRLDSTPGQGTTVRLYLPRHLGTAAAPVQAAIPFSGPANATALAGTVLVVEDEDAVRLLVVEALQDLGCHVVQAVDGPSGLRRLQSSETLDMLVSDVGLPGLNGRQLADAARVTRPSLPVLFITGYAGSALQDWQLAPGMQVMGKPFKLTELAACVRRMMDRSRSPNSEHLGQYDPQPGETG